MICWRFLIDSQLRFAAWRLECTKLPTNISTRQFEKSWATNGVKWVYRVDTYSPLLLTFCYTHFRVKSRVSGDCTLKLRIRDVKMADLRTSRFGREQVNWWYSSWSVSRCYYLMAFYDRLASDICSQIKGVSNAQSCSLISALEFENSWACYTTEMGIWGRFIVATQTQLPLHSF